MHQLVVQWTRQCLELMEDGEDLEQPKLWLISLNIQSQKQMVMVIQPHGQIPEQCSILTAKITKWPKLVLSKKDMVLPNLETLILMVLQVLIHQEIMSILI